MTDAKSKDRALIAMLLAVNSVLYSEDRKLVIDPYQWSALRAARDRVEHELLYEEEPADE